MHLLLVGFVLHFFRLDQPASVVFDEVHFGGFADAYCCTGEYFFDVHPHTASCLRRWD